MNSWYTVSLQRLLLLRLVSSGMVFYFKLKGITFAHKLLACFLSYSLSNYIAIVHWSEEIIQTKNSLPICFVP